MVEPQLLGLAPSFGFGDRIGCATPGHVEAMRRAGGAIQPIFAQQSIREMRRTSRTPEGVMKDALSALEECGWDGQTGADADHLKTTEDVDATFAAGYTFFTIDPSDVVDQQADEYIDRIVEQKFEMDKDQIDWFDEYLGQSVTLPNGTGIRFDELSLKRAAIKYGPAINEAVRLSDHIRARHDETGRPYEIELSVDETQHPTTLAEHYIIADQCLKRGMKLVSLAPRFVGNFEKGVDFKGDVDVLQTSLHDHAAIAEMLGPYKLSLHSGSDKLSMYAALARATSGRFHVKTAGTSYLEALRVVARHDEPLFRSIIDFARQYYDRDRATYHVSATLDDAPPQNIIADADELEKQYLGWWDDVPDGEGFTAPGRQILHCTFGSVLRDAELGAGVRRVLEAEPETYRDVLADHFERHLKALHAGM
jgi:tagaturonate epimerase